MPLRDDAPRDLLFGLLALQTGMVDRPQLVAAFGAWTASPGRSMADLLVEQGALSTSRRVLLDALLAEHLTAHRGDAEESLAALEVGRSTREDLAAAVGPELEATLAHVGSALDSTVDADRTTAYGVGTATSDGQRFRVLRPHARGGLGAVFVALDGELNREVALKEILDHRADDPASRQRFLREAEITGGLEHPGIVPVYGLGTYAGGRPYYAMRFIRGDSLKEAIARFHADPAFKSDPGRRSLALRGLLRRFIDVCNAVHYAHSRGVLHRDLKPGNVIVGKYGETLVVDWGLAKATGKADLPAEERALSPSSSSGSAETLPGSALGTPGYMNPEQARGELERLGPRSDVYSLGATLYSLLCGRAPFEGDDIGAILRAVWEGRFDPPRQVEPGIDPALEAICLKAMRLDPEERYATASDLAGDIERWLADEPVSAHEEPAWDRLARWGCRHRPLVAGVAALLLTAVGALAVGLYAVGREQGRTRAQRDRAEQALLAESRARKRTRETLDEMTSQVIEDLMARKGSARLEPAQEEFLEKSLALYRDFAAETGNDPAVRWGVAEAHRRIAVIQRRLGRLPAAEAALAQALAIADALASKFAREPQYRKGQAVFHHGLAAIQEDTSRPSEAEAHERRALSLLASLPDELRSDPRVIGDQARSETTLGNVLFSLGRFEDAERATRDAIATARKAVAASSRPTYRYTLALILDNLASHANTKGRYPDAEAPAREAIGLFKGLVREQPFDPSFRSLLATGLETLGTSLRATGRTAEAEAAYRESLSTLGPLATEFPGVPDYRSNMARTHDSLAILMATDGRPREAEPHFREEVAIYRRLADDFPSEPRFQDHLGGALGNLGVLLYTTGRTVAAEETYQETIAVLRRLADRYPDRSGYRSSTAVWLFNLSLLLLKSAQPRRAEAAVREAIGLQRPLVAGQPGQARYRFHLTKSLTVLGDLLNGDDRPAEAEAAVREVVALLSRLAADFPKVVEYREEQANSLGHLGTILRRQGRPREAEPLHREAMAILEKIVAEAPKNPHYRMELATERGSLARLLNGERRFPEARRLLEQAGPELNAALRSNPDYEQYRDSVRDNRTELAICLAGLGEYPSARAEAERIARLGWSPTEDAYAAASALAACSAIVPRGAGGDQRTTGPWSEAFASAALAQLHAAIAAGFDDARRIGRDDSFEGMRARAEFRSILMGLPLPAEPFAPP